MAARRARDRAAAARWSKKPVRRLSVIIPALNEEHAIRDTLSDLAPARAAGHEIIVVDGGSTDATVAVASSLADRIVHAPRGRACQMNAGAGEAQGDAFWFLHADTRVPETAISALLQALDDGRRWGRFDVRLSGRQATLRLIGSLMNLRSSLSGICTGDQGIFVTREAFDNVGGFPGIALMEDIALTKALRARSRPACLKPALVTSSRRWERAGIWRTVLLMWRLRLAYALGADPDGLAKRYHP